MSRFCFAVFGLSVLLTMAFGLGWRVTPVRATSLAVNSSSDMPLDAPDAWFAQSRTFTVNTASDTDDDDLGDGSCADQFGFCSLRAAIQESNLTAVADTILLATSAMNEFAVHDLPAILYPVTIEGQGRDVTTIKANGIDVVGLDLRANVTLRNMKLRGFSIAVKVDVAGLTIAINNCRLNENQTALVVTQASTVGFYESYINDNTQKALSAANGGIVNLEFSGVFDNNNTDSSCAAVLVGAGATLSASDSFFSTNVSPSVGGAICNNGDTISLVDCSVSDNTANSWGGGLYQTSGQTFIKGNSSINGNHASFGGGIYVSGGSLEVGPRASNWPEIAHNTASTSGAGLYLEGSGTLTLTETLIDSNTAPQSAGILYAGSGSLTIRDSAVVRNTATAGSAGGLSFLNSSVTLRVINSTISGNKSTNHGGGLVLGQGTAQLSNVTISNNTCNSDNLDGGQGGGIYRTGALVTLHNSIVAGNIDSPLPTDPNAPDIDGAIGSAGYNMIGVCNFFCTITGSQTGNWVGVTNPGLDPLILDEFAPRPYSPYHPLQASSPAVNAGNITGCRDQAGELLPTDQLGKMRAVWLRCDMGAFESPHNSVIPKALIFLPFVIR
jgi:CSLREA domain-containing protein